MSKKAYVLSVLTNVLDHYPGHIYWHDIEGTCLGCNQKQADALGLSANDISGKSLYDLYPKPEADKLVEIIQYILNTGETIICEEVLTVGGQKRHFSSEKRPMYDKEGNLIGVIGLSMDISKEKNLHNQLKVVSEKLTVAKAVRQRFLENMAHDWRTPLGNIQGLTELLAEEVYDLEFKKLLNSVSDCAKELLYWFDTLSELSKSKSKAILEKPFSLKEVVDRVVKIAHPSCCHRRLTFALNYDDKLPKIVLGDPNRVQAILMYLVDNAIKFNRKGGCINLTVLCYKKIQRKGQSYYVIKCSVEDTGIGIPVEERDYIFETFYKVHPSWRGLYKGMGVGLKLVKEFLNDLKGELHVDSQINQGTTFTVLFPVKITLLDS